jgi:hypothetical protein
LAKNNNYQYDPAIHSKRPQFIQNNDNNNKEIIDHKIIRIICTLLFIIAMIVNALAGQNKLGG